MFSPVNRHLVIEIPEKDAQQTSTGILLPEDYSPTQEKYIVATAQQWSSDVRFAEQMTPGCEILIDSSMIQEITVKNEKFTIVLDNYVIGIL